MTDMKCPFCQQELEQDYCDCIMFECHNPKCKHYYDSFIGREELWQELIRTRKALEIAVDTLNYIRRTNPISFHFEAIEKALEQITALEQKKTAFVNNKIKFPEYNDNLLEEFDKQFFENGQDDI